MTIVEVAGELDIATVSLLAKALGDAAQSGKSHVILDAQKLTYVDSAGIQTMLSAHRNLSTKGRKLVIVGCHGVFNRLMQICMLESRFQMYPTIEEAVSALSSSA
jgi:anti-anti-sigma factor